MLVNNGYFDDWYSPATSAQDQRVKRRRMLSYRALRKRETSMDAQRRIGWSSTGSANGYSGYQYDKFIFSLEK